ncbi:MAG: hypothetical protein GF307_02480 [candidate division Zixibacteria bacterium]|nr:hypothetical protein [candidate division Zixibacteria bacterium]
MDEVRDENVSSEEIRQLKEELGNLKNDFKGLVDAAKKAGITKSDDTYGRIKEYIGGLDEKLRDTYGDASEYVREHGEKAIKVSRTTIEEKPFATIMASFLAGVVVGRLILK